MRAFVTGGTGLLGNNLVRLLVEQGWEVKALVRSKEKADRLLGALPVMPVVGDLLETERWANEMRGCDVLFHTAAYFRETFRRGRHDAALERINVQQAVKLFELAQASGIGKIIHTSTNAVIGKRRDRKPSGEADRLKPEQALNAYGRSKALGDEAIARFVRQSGMPVVTVLPGWMFGPGDAAPTGSGQLVLNFLNRKLPGSFPSGIDAVDARDVAQAMLSAVANGRAGESYLVSGEHIDLKRLFALLEKVSGVPAPKRHFPYPVVYASTWLNAKLAALNGKETDLSPDELRVMTERKRTSSAKAVKELQAAFRPMEETLRDTVGWYLAHRPEMIQRG